LVIGGGGGGGVGDGIALQMCSKLVTSLIVAKSALRRPTVSQPDLLPDTFVCNNRIADLWFDCVQWFLRYQ